jgi:hypothetical protein
MTDLDRGIRPHTNPYWARVVGNSPFFLYVIHKEALYPSSGDINRLVMDDDENRSKGFKIVS